MSESLDDVLDRVHKLIRTNDPTALDETYRLTEQYPEERKAWMVLRYAHLKNDNIDGQIAALTRALEILPPQPDIVLQRGQLERDRENFEAALADFDQAVALEIEREPDPDVESIHFYRAEVLLQLDRREEAHAALEHVSDGYKGYTIKLLTKRELLAACDGREWNWEEDAVTGSVEVRTIAIDMGALEDAPKAIEYAKRLTADYPDDPAVWQLLAYTHSIHEDYAAAVAVMQKAIDLDPKEPAWFSYRAEKHVELANDEAALADMTQAIALCDDEKRDEIRLIGFWVWRADILLRLGRKAEARAALAHVPDGDGARTTRIRTKEEMLAECDA